MRLAVLLVTGLLPACQLVFALDATDPAIDAVHLEPGAQAGSVNFDLVDTTIDTTELRSLDDVVTLETATHLGADFDVAVLRVNRLTIRGVVNVVGERPLVVLARLILVEGTLDAGAKGGVPGPGGGVFGGLAEPGFAANGTGSGANHAGGGGGGYGGPGAPGGAFGVDNVGDDCPTPLRLGGAEGAEHGDPEISVLVGGGAGGTGSGPSTCAGERSVPGAGGGVLQLSAIDRIQVANLAIVNAGGGGGRGGLLCVDAPSSGPGGGSGGSIYLDAPELEIIGTVSANGGGGGSSSEGGSVDEAGGDGEDGVDVDPANGGLPPGSGQSRGGGRGGARDAGPNRGGQGCNVDAGGGGGAAGRIVQRGGIVSIGSISPVPLVLDR